MAKENLLAGGYYSTHMVSENMLGGYEYATIVVHILSDIEHEIFSP